MHTKIVLILFFAVSTFCVSPVQGAASAQRPSIAAYIARADMFESEKITEVAAALHAVYSTGNALKRLQVAAAKDMRRQYMEKYKRQECLTNYVTAISFLKNLCVELSLPFQSFEEYLEIVTIVVNAQDVKKIFHEGMAFVAHQVIWEYRLKLFIRLLADFFPQGTYAQKEKLVEIISTWGPLGMQQSKQPGVAFEQSNTLWHQIDYLKEDFPEEEHFSPEGILAQ